jgi:hypothetical protein
MTAESTAGIRYGACVRGPKTLKRHIFRVFRVFFLMSGFIFVTLLLCDATDFRNQLPKHSQLC